MSLTDAASPAPAAAPAAVTSERGVLLVAAGAAFLALLDTTVANLAVADVRSDFAGTTVGGATWLITIYAVVFAALLAPAGRVADVVGRRALLLGGVAAFTMFSLACALAPSLELLLVSRALQGAAAAAMIPASLAVVLMDAPPERRAAAIGLWSAAGALAAAAGPAIGGVLVDAVGWRALFLVNVPVGLAIVAGTRLVPRSAPRRTRLPDAAGTLLLGAGIGAAALGISQGPDWGWGDGRTLGALIGAALAVAVALWRSTRHATPADRDGPVALALVRDGQPRVAALRRRAVPVDARRRPVPRRGLGLLAARGRALDDAGRDHRGRRGAARGAGRRAPRPVGGDRRRRARARRAPGCCAPWRCPSTPRSSPSGCRSAS